MFRDRYFLRSYVVECTRQLPMIVAILLYEIVTGLLSLKSRIGCDSHRLSDIVSLVYAIEIERLFSVNCGGRVLKDYRFTLGSKVTLL